MNRELGFWETWTLDNNYVVVVVGEVRGPILNMNSLQRGSQALIQRHPLLRSDVIITNDTHFFSPITAPIIPVSIITAQNSHDWQAHVERELDTPIPHGKGIPLCRISLLVFQSEQKLVLSFSHAIGDGTAAMILMKDFLQACASEQNVESLSPLPYVVDLMFPDGISEKDQKIIDQVWCCKNVQR
jgi:hypothetical protein